MADSGFFENRACEYYPCHDTGGGALNCLFCYCPLYWYDCPGEPRTVEIKGTPVRDCSACGLPHDRDNSAAIIEIVRERIVKGRPARWDA